MYIVFSNKRINNCAYVRSIDKYIFIYILRQDQYTLWVRSQLDIKQNQKCFSKLRNVIASHAKHSQQSIWV